MALPTETFSERLTLRPRAALQRRPVRWRTLAFMPREETSARLSLLHARSIESCLHAAVTDIRLEQHAGASALQVRALIDEARELLKSLHLALGRVPPGTVRDRFRQRAEGIAGELARAEAITPAL